MKPRAIVVALTLVCVLLVSTYAWTRRGSPDPSRQAGPAAAPGAGAVQFEVTGVVMAPAQGRQVSIAHDDIPGFMPAMTMPFTMGTGVDAGALRPGDRVRFALRIDPMFDTPQVLHAYGTAMKADLVRWRFATGTPEAIDAFAKAFAVYTERSGVSLDHTLATALIGTDGRVVEIWRGNGWKTSEVLAALRAASGT